MNAEPRLSRPLLTILVLAVLAVPLLVAASSQAALYCVSMSSCAGGTIKVSLQEAIVDADGDGVADTIKIGASALPHTGKFSALGSDKLVIEGAGQDETVLIPNTESVTTLALGGDGNSVVSDLTVVTRNASGNRGLLLVDATARRVRVSHVGSENDLLGVDLVDSSVFEEGAVEMDQGTAFRALETGNHPVIRDTKVRAWGGLSALSGAAATVVRSRFEMQRSAITTSGTSSVTIDDSVLTHGSELEDCTISALAGTVIANHLTVIGNGHGSGVCSWSNTVFTTTVSLTNSIVYGHSYDLSRAGEPTSTANLTVQYSRYGNAYNDTTPPLGSFTKGTGVISSVPSFVDAAGGDYRLKAPSPLIDAGDPTDALSLDIEKLPRKVNGDTVAGAQSDIGAHEYQRKAPNAVATIPASAVAGEQVLLDAAGSSDQDPGDTLTFAWDFGDGSGGGSAEASHVFATAATYEVKLTVTDPTGLQDTATGTITVVAASPPGGGDDGSGSGDGRAGGGTAAADAIAPRISLLEIRPSRLRLGTALPTLSSKPGRRAIRIAVSEPATIRLLFARIAVGKNRRGKATAGLTLKVPAGVSLVRFQGRLSRKRSLRPGRYRVTAVARDAAGNRGKPRSAKFRLLPRRAAG